MDVHRLQSQLGRAREVQQLLDQLIDPIDLTNHDVDKFVDCWVGIDGAAQELGGAFDASEGIADFVRQARR